MSQHLQPAESPIREDDAVIEEMLKRANLPALLASMVHITGDCEILRSAIRPGARLNLAVKREHLVLLKD